MYTLNDIRKFINKETHATIGEMFHFLKNQIEVSHKSVYKYLYKELKLKIETLKLLLAELLTYFEIYNEIDVERNGYAQLLYVSLHCVRRIATILVVFLL